MALGFDIADRFLASVKYRKTRLECDWDKLRDSEDYGVDFMMKVLSSKSDHWAYEEEVRLHVGLDEPADSDGNFFLEFGSSLVLKEIVVGHDCDTAREGLEDLILGLGDSVKLTKARIAFNSFNVVRQQNRDLW